MKHLCFILLISMPFFFGLSNVQADEHIVEARGTTIPTDFFVPDTVMAEVGDTITWIWIDGVHTTEYTNIPVDADTWASNLDQITQTFSYVVTVPGLYNYTCHKIAPHGMDGTLIVSEKVSTAVETLDMKPLNSTVYPNPFSNQISFEFSDAERILVYNIKGELMEALLISKQNTKIEINTEDWSNGMYFYSIISDEQILSRGKMVKN